MHNLRLVQGPGCSSLLSQKWACGIQVCWGPENSEHTLHPGQRVASSGVEQGGDVGCWAVTAGARVGRLGQAECVHEGSQGGDIQPEGRC